jgi:hypothetical protein
MNCGTKPKPLKEKRITIYFARHATVGKTELCASFVDDCEVCPILAGSTAYRLQSLIILTQVNAIRGANMIGSTDSESGVYIFSKNLSYLKILGVMRVICSKFHAQDTQKLGATVQNLVTTAT